ncbi:response regulator transcription factor [Echinimonas agarilytica]|uniref:DNA-binding response regulator n=1 Tax=Echinimonas agarilytica TaxID=1215918 RepID=A0AA41W5M9_9GAMM|nr:DNA-binding response regulator [Echinimonas agarilytica]MCM2679173.1 DNA-binding response regulator [Echinimonas agarilytica]
MKAVASDSAIVLVVDDSPESLGMLNIALNNAGLMVLVALNGAQALSIIERITPDVVLLDGIMPEMDGFDTCRAIKQKLPNIPVIFMTGLTDSEYVIKGFEVGGVDYVTKPIVPDEVLARIRVHTQNAKLTQSAQAALDYAGQYVFCVSNDGALEWATPHVHELVDSLNGDAPCAWEQIQQLLAPWLAQGDQSQPLELTNFEPPLQAYFAGEHGSNHLLVRLVTPKKTKTAEALQQELPLTKREAQVLYWVSFGKTNWEVAQILDMSPRTVNKHLEQVFKKMGVDNRTAAAAISIRILESDEEAVG